MSKRLQINRVERFRDGHKFDCTIHSFWGEPEKICFISDFRETMHFHSALQSTDMVTNHGWAMQLFDEAKLFEQAFGEKAIE